ncbi:MAG TPA: hypothetical protein VF631_00335 [Allosphingosinicella sp.]|jgi:hypothetical protein|uniref:hypothetical protein n=1 Tax=Allosphingosinicella sp. TaxID=2823234 RepID=UPI002F29FEA3
METDLEFYTRCMIEALQSARRATSLDARRRYEQLARAFTLQVHKAENTPTRVTPEPLRLRPLHLTA